MKYLLILMAIIACLIFTSYTYYEKYTETRQLYDNVKIQLSECQKQKQQLSDVSKTTSDGLATALSDNEKLSKDFQTLKDQLKAKRCTNANPITGDGQKDISSASPHSYVSDVNSLLKQGRDKATSGVSEPSKSSPK